MEDGELLRTKRRITNYIADHKGFRRDGAKSMVEEFENAIRQDERRSLLVALRSYISSHIGSWDSDRRFNDCRDQVLDILDRNISRVT